MRYLRPFSLSASSPPASGFVTRFQSFDASWLRQVPCSRSTPPLSSRFTGFYSHVTHSGRSGLPASLFLLSSRLKVTPLHRLSELLAERNCQTHCLVQLEN